MIRRGLPLGAWPEVDRRAWNRAIADGDIFGRGPAAHWAQTTRHAVVAAYGRWLGFLTEYEPSVLNEDPLLRLTGDRLARYVDHLSQTAGSVGLHAYSAHLRDAVRVMCPGKVASVLVLVSPTVLTIGGLVKDDQPRRGRCLVTSFVLDRAGAGAAGRRRRSWRS
jgi:hypothetical protein